MDFAAQYTGMCLPGALGHAANVRHLHWSSHDHHAVHLVSGNAQSTHRTTVLPSQPASHNSPVAHSEVKWGRCQLSPMTQPLCSCTDPVWTGCHCQSRSCSSWFSERPWLRGLPGSPAYEIWVSPFCYVIIHRTACGNRKKTTKPNARGHTGGHTA